MAYIDQVSPKDRAASIGGVVAVHAALGCALVFGLQATGMVSVDEKIESIFIPKVEIDPPPPPPKPDEAVPEPTTSTQVYLPPTEIPLALDPPKFETLDFPPISEPVIPLVLPPHDPPAPPGNPPAAFDPVGAKPKNSPGGWITDSDYRTSWINREMTGIAGFKVTVGTDGRGENCAITQSTGHTALDEATCRLIERRARFEPARNAQGEKVRGSFANKVAWRIPD